MFAGRVCHAKRSPKLSEANAVNVVDIASWERMNNWGGGILKGTKKCVENRQLHNEDFGYL